MAASISQFTTSSKRNAAGQQLDEVSVFTSNLLDPEGDPIETEIAIDATPAGNTVPDVDLVGQAILPTGFIPTGAAGTINGASVHLGGLSGVTYDAANNQFYAISNDRSQFDPARFYTFGDGAAGESI